MVKEKVGQARETNKRKGLREPTCVNYIAAHKTKKPKNQEKKLKEEEQMNLKRAIESDMKNTTLKWLVNSKFGGKSEKKRKDKTRESQSKKNKE